MIYSMVALYIVLAEFEIRRGHRAIAGAFLICSIMMLATIARQQGWI